MEPHHDLVFVVAGESVKLDAKAEVAADGGGGAHSFRPRPGRTSLLRFAQELGRYLPSGTHHHGWDLVEEGAKGPQRREKEEE